MQLLSTFLKLCLIFCLLESASSSSEKSNEPITTFDIACVYNNEAFKVKHGIQITRAINPNCDYHFYSYYVLDFEKNGAIRFANPRKLSEETQIMKNFVQVFREKTISTKSKIFISIGSVNLKLIEFIEVTKTLDYELFAKALINLRDTVGFDGVDFKFVAHEVDLNSKSNQELKDFFINLKFNLNTIIWKNKLRSIDLSVTAFSSSSSAFALINEISEFLRSFDLVTIVPFNYEYPFSLMDRPEVAKFMLPLATAQNSTQLSFTDVVDGTAKLSIPRHKLIIALPLFGVTHTLKNYFQNKLGDPITGPGKPNFLTKKSGFISYGEICYVISNQQPKNRIWDSNAMVPYIQYSNQWISYENEESFKLKIDMMKCTNLKMIAIFSLDYDDHDRKCWTTNSTFATMTEYIFSQTINDRYICPAARMVTNENKVTSENIKKKVAVKIIKHQQKATTVETNKNQLFIMTPQFCEDPNNENKYAADKIDCNVFYQCSNKRPIKHRCPNNLVYNYKNNVCDFVINVPHCA